MENAPASQPSPIRDDMRCITTTPAGDYHVVVRTRTGVYDLYFFATVAEALDARRTQVRRLWDGATAAQRAVVEKEWVVLKQRDRDADVLDAIGTMPEGPAYHPLYGVDEHHPLTAATVREHKGLFIQPFRTPLRIEAKIYFNGHTIGCGSFQCTWAGLKAARAKQAASAAAAADGTLALPARRMGQLQKAKRQTVARNVVMDLKRCKGTGGRLVESYTAYRSIDGQRRSVGVYHTLAAAIAARDRVA